METNLFIDPETRDIDFGSDGELIMIAGADVYAQAVRSTLQTFKGEWFLDMEHGTDYCEIIGEYPDNLLVEDIISEAVYQEENVQAINDIRIEQKGRTLAVQIEARLSSGENIFAEVNQNG